MHVCCDINIKRMAHQFPNSRIVAWRVRGGQLVFLSLSLPNHPLNGCMAGDRQNVWAPLECVAWGIVSLYSLMLLCVLCVCVWCVSVPC